MFSKYQNDIMIIQILSPEDMNNDENWINETSFQKLTGLKYKMKHTNLKKLDNIWFWKLKQ